jgi:hypothetical protein
VKSDNNHYPCNAHIRLQMHRISQLTHAIRILFLHPFHTQSAGRTHRRGIDEVTFSKDSFHHARLMMPSNGVYQYNFDRYDLQLIPVGSTENRPIN